VGSSKCLQHLNAGNSFIQSFRLGTPRVQRLQNDVLGIPEPATPQPLPVSGLVISIVMGQPPRSIIDELLRTPA
jgi:hypothetical protein